MERVDTQISDLTPSKRVVTARVVFQFFLFAMCFYVTVFLRDYLVAHSLFSFSWPEYTGLREFFRLLLIVVALMPMYFTLEVITFHLSLSKLEKKHAPKMDPLFDFVIIPASIFILMVLICELLFNLARGFSFADIRGQFPGCSRLSDWIFDTVRIRTPQVWIPTSSVLSALAFAWFILVVDSARQVFVTWPNVTYEAERGFYAALTSGILFLVLSLQALAFSVRIWRMPSAVVRKESPPA